MRTLLLGVLGGLVLGFWTPGAASAASYRIVYEGVIDSVVDPGGLLAGAGAPVAPSDAFRVDVIGTPGGGWSGPATIAGTAFHGTFNDFVTDDDVILGDSVRLQSAAVYDVATGLQANIFNVVLTQGDGSALDSAAFPSALDLGDWAFRGISVGYLPSGVSQPDYEIQGTITSVSLTQVPEPRVAALLSLGLAALTIRRRRA